MEAALTRHSFTGEIVQITQEVALTAGHLNSSVEGKVEPGTRILSERL